MMMISITKNLPKSGKLKEKIKQSQVPKEIGDREMDQNVLEKVKLSAPQPKIFLILRVYLSSSCHGNQIYQS